MKHFYEKNMNALPLWHVRLKCKHHNIPLHINISQIYINHKSIENKEMS